MVKVWKTPEHYDKYIHAKCANAHKYSSECVCHDNTKRQLYLCARHTTAWEIWNNFRDDINANKQTNVHIERQSTQNARKYYIIFFVIW